MPDLSLPATVLAGQVWNFEHLAVTPNTILGSRVPTQALLNVRRTLDQDFSAAGLDPAPLDIVHATLMRVVGYETKNDLSYFANQLLGIRDGLVPLKLMIGAPYWGTVEGLLNEETTPT